MNENMILECYQDLLTIVMNDDIVCFSCIELICIELYMMINMMVCNDDGLNNDHTRT